MKARRTPIILLLLFLLAPPLWAQDEEGQDRFLLTGYGFGTVEDPSEGDTESHATLAPIVLARLSEDWLFEAEGEIEYEEAEGTTEAGLEYAQLDWLATDTLTVVFGKYLTPFGTFIEKLHPAWINKLPAAPFAYHHGQSLVPLSQLGLQVRGAVPIGDGYRRFTYTFYVANGLEVGGHGHEEGEMHDDEEGEEHDEEGEEHGEEPAEEPLFFADRGFDGNGDVSFGGRAAVFPAQGFEIGASYFTGSYDEDGNLSTDLLGVDFVYHHDLFDLRGEWLDRTTERVAHDGDPLADEKTKSWYFQPSLRLSIIPVYFFNKMELVARLGRLEWDDEKTDEMAFGLNYYFTGSQVVRLAWRQVDSGHRKDDSLLAMFAWGF